MVTKRLRIEPARAPVINDYRIRDNHVEVRTLDGAGHAFDPALSTWKTLNENDVQLHFALGTVVAKWLQIYLPEESSAPAPGCLFE
ncbi:MAG TPA: hypothetical protein VFI82_02170 [Terriglobales bacterium]|jgi:hypothetical protein|nr:hypothetical protein [Terriglobales bacterium]